MSVWGLRSVDNKANRAVLRNNNNTSNTDDADVAAGMKQKKVETEPLSMNGGRPSDLEFFEDLVSEPVLVLGMDISHLNPQNQFLVCASGVFAFSLLYGYLQELISVQIANRQLGLFLATMQFSGYTVLSWLLRTYVYEKHHQGKKSLSDVERKKKLLREKRRKPSSSSSSMMEVPFVMYLGLSLLRAVDLAMTNLAMQYINYPAKTLMKSSRVVFTMIFGVFISKKRYRLVDYVVVLCMVIGLAVFMHADANSSAVFQPIGVVMLTISLLCDGAITNMSEKIMKNYGVGQDEFIFKMYSIALVAITAAAWFKGDLYAGVDWLLRPGTYKELQTHADPTWSVGGKIMVTLLFSSMGFVGSSFSAAITKNFGALTMSITSTARKATTLFLSFFLFDNACTMEHIAGVVIFVTALTTKSLRRRNDSKSLPLRSKSSDKLSIPHGGGSSSSSSSSLDRLNRYIRPFARGSKITTPTKRKNHHKGSGSNVPVTSTQTNPLLAQPGTRNIENHAMIV